jgi:aminoglycoside phosphotransferase (APT) family kinase protein
MTVSKGPADVGAIVAEVWPGATLIEVTDLKGGISSRIRAFVVEQPDGTRERFVLREPSDWARSNDPQIARTEAHLMTASVKAGVPAPMPIHVDTKNDPPDYLVTTFIPGRQSRDSAFLTDHAGVAAQVLARIHTIPTPPLPDLMPMHGAISDMVAFDHKPEDMDHAAQEPAIRTALREHWPPRFNAPCQLHGDFWPGNILWQDGRVSAVLDWEDSLIGDPMYDLAVARLDWLWVSGPEGMDAFTRAFLQAAPHLNADALPLWDLAVATRPLYGFAEWGTGWEEFGRPDITEAAMRESHKWFVDQALDALDA